MDWFHQAASGKSERTLIGVEVERTHENLLRGPETMFCPSITIPEEMSKQDADAPRGGNDGSPIVRERIRCNIFNLTPSRGVNKKQIPVSEQGD